MIIPCNHPSRVAAILIFAIFLISSLVQLWLELHGTPTSIIRLVIWSLIYFCLIYGLYKNMRLMRLGSLLLGLLQIIPALLISNITPEQILGRVMPDWYQFIVYCTAFLGLGLIANAILGRWKYNQSV